jgi:hypothetical protein
MSNDDKFDAAIAKLAVIGFAGLLMFAQYTSGTLEPNPIIESFVISLLF